MYSTLKPNQLEAIAEFAKANGRNWKQALRAAWMSGDYAGFEYSNELQNIRNTFGPSWLVSFSLKKAIEQSSESLEELAVKPAQKITQAAVKAELAELGVSLRKDWTGDFIVRVKALPVDTEYFTNSLEDALQTGRVMARDYRAGRAIEESSQAALKPVASNTGLLETIAAISADIDSKPAEQKYSLVIRVSGHHVSTEENLSIGEAIESLKLWCVNGSYSAEITPADELIRRGSR